MINTTDTFTLRTSNHISLFLVLYHSIYGYCLYLLTLGSRLIYALMKLCMTRHFYYIPSLGKVTPECDHAAAELSFFVVVPAVTKRNSEHVAELVPVKGIASPLRPRTDRIAMDECVHVNLVLQQFKHMLSIVQMISRLRTPFFHVPKA